MDFTPVAYLILTLVFLVVLLRMRAVAIRRPRVSDDEWAEDARTMHYMKHGTYNVEI